MTFARCDLADGKQHLTLMRTIVIGNSAVDRKWLRHHGLVGLLPYLAAAAGCSVMDSTRFG